MDSSENGINGSREMFWEEWENLSPKEMLSLPASIPLSTDDGE